jgi:hypothetical protein
MVPPDMPDIPRGSDYWASNRRERNALVELLRERGGRFS